MNNATTFGRARGRYMRGTLSMRFGLRFNIVLSVFVLWTFLQATMALQFLPFDLIQKINYLKEVLPASGILVCCLIYLDRLKLNNVFLPFVLFCFFVICNTIFHMIFTEVGLIHLSQPLMFIVWTFCMFVLVPSVFDSLLKIRRLLWPTTVVLMFTLLFASIWSFSHGFEIARVYGGSRHGAIRYSFSYLNPGYLGGICYSIVGCSLMLVELSTVKWQKIMLFIFILISLLSMVLASSRTYMLASVIMFLFYFRYKSGLSKKLSHIVIVVSALLLIRILWNLLLDVNYFNDLNLQSSNRLAMWITYFKNMMLNGIGWKLFVGNGIYVPNWTQAITLAGGDVVKTFTRFAIDNVYLEMLIMQGAIGLALFIWGLFRLLAKGNVFSKLDRIPDGGRLRAPLSVAFGSLVGLLVGAFFNSLFPSLGNTINSMLLPVSVAIIFVVSKNVRLESERVPV